MNYKKIYDTLVEKAKVRGLDKSQHEGYFEIHHIVPRCLGGTDESDNLVMLTGREHYVSHMLLWKAYPTNNSLFHAAAMMSNRFSEFVTSRRYEVMRKGLASRMSSWRSGKYKDLTGQKFSRLEVISFAELRTPPSGGNRNAYWNCLCDCGNEFIVMGSSLTTGNTQSCGCLIADSGKERSGENNHMWGKKHSEETLAKFKFRRVLRGEEHPCFGKKFSEERRKKMSEAMTGVPWSEERRAAAVFPTGEDHPFFGKSHTKDTRQKISEILKSKNQRPWENLSTQTDESLTKWAMCDYYYKLWVDSGKLGLKRFTKFYNETHDDSVSLAFFTNPRIKFIDGWVPQEDQQWVEFSRRYLGG